MAYETYPKGSKNPSISVGEQDNEPGWNVDSDSTTGYATNNGAKDTIYNGDRSKTLTCACASATAPKASYPKKAPRKFGTEKAI